MKCLLLFVFMVCVATASAQQQKLQQQKKKELAITNKDFKGTNRKVFFSDTALNVPQAQRNIMAQRKPGIYALPLDGMPCIVPDTKSIVAIPNAFIKKDLPKLGKIPNATPLTGDQLKKNQQRFYVPPSR